MGKTVLPYLAANTSIVHAQLDRHRYRVMTPFATVVVNTDLLARPLPPARDEWPVELPADWLCSDAEREEVVALARKALGEYFEASWREEEQPAKAGG